MKKYHVSTPIDISSKGANVDTVVNCNSQPIGYHHMHVPDTLTLELQSFNAKQQRWLLT